MNEPDIPELPGRPGEVLRHSVRRRDRAQGEAWIREFLRREAFGFLAMVEGGRPSLASNLFVFDPQTHSIYLHSARAGTTSAVVAGGGPVAFSIARMGRLLPAAEALEFSVEYASVVVTGRTEPVEEPAEKRRVLELLMEKYAPHLTPGVDYRAITERELEATGVHAVRIEAWSGKEKVAAEDFPGAFSLR